jgi:septum formation protein
VIPDVAERTDGEPETAVLENAREKARAGLASAGGQGGLVVGVDTEVVLDGRLLGKAGDEREARERLRALSDRTHDVLSGVVVLAAGPSISHPAPSEWEGHGLGREGAPSVPEPRPDERSAIERSQVTFRSLSDRHIDAYLASGEWRGRAGAYAIQGLGSSLVERTEGDLSNVIGLPVNLLMGLLSELLDDPSVSGPRHGPDPQPQG